MFKKMLDSTRSESLGNRFRRKRFRIFTDLIKDFQRPVKILDLGGNENFWIQMGTAGNPDFEVLLLNPEITEESYQNIRYLKGDARSFLYERLDFDVIFSNSAIEHTGGISGSELMAKEILSSGKPYFVQTPNYYFPFEPHFLFPFFQFFPTGLKLVLVRNFNMGWFTKCLNKKEAIELVNSINLLKKKDLRKLFPNSEIHEEKFLGLIKSFSVVGRF
jgi:hypothetical protein